MFWVWVCWVFLSVLTRGISYSLAGKHGNLNSKDVAELAWDEIPLCKVTSIFSILSSFEGYN